MRVLWLFVIFAVVCSTPMIILTVKEKLHKRKMKDKLFDYFYGNNDEVDE